MLLSPNTTRFAVTTALLILVGCNNRPDSGPEEKPLSKTESAKYRQVTIQVTGLT